MSVVRKILFVEIRLLAKGNNSGEFEPIRRRK
jgi:hypothetical protein